MLLVSTWHVVNIRNVSPQKSPGLCSLISIFPMSSQKPWQNQLRVLRLRQNVMEWKEMQNSNNAQTWKGSSPHPSHQEWLRSWYAHSCPQKVRDTTTKRSVEKKNVVRSKSCGRDTSGHSFSLGVFSEVGKEAQTKQNRHHNSFLDIHATGKKNIYRCITRYKFLYTSYVYTLNLPHEVSLF